MWLLPAAAAVGHLGPEWTAWRKAGGLQERLLSGLRTDMGVLISLPVSTVVFVSLLPPATLVLLSQGTVPVVTLLRSMGLGLLALTVPLFSSSAKFAADPIAGIPKHATSVHSMSHMAARLCSAILIQTEPYQ
jgi:hypothetical protein